MRAISITSLLFAYVTLVCGQKCGPTPPPYALGAAANDNCYSITIANQTIAPDEVPRKAITIDGKMPGTVLTAHKGENLYVQVKNRIKDKDLLELTSIHWHGIRQPRTAYDDGPAFVTQCPITPDYNYTYKVNTTDQTGTYWYHSHYHSQYVDGLRGALVIYDDAEKVQYDYTEDNENTIITITDWYHDTSQDIINKGLSQSGDVGLLNGKGRYRNPNNTSAPTTGERAVITVEKGKKYRFRLINMSGRSSFWFGIEGHRLRVIESDGISNHNNSDPVTSLWISAGQRYSFILEANQDVKNYWIAYPPRDFSARNLRNGVGAFAVLHYQGASAPDTKGPDPKFEVDKSKYLVEANLRPLNQLNRYENSLNLSFSFNIFNGKWYMTSENKTLNFTYTSPSVPTLLEILANSGSNTTQLPEDVIFIPQNTSVYVTIAGGKGNDNHPFHLHGHHFEIIQSATGKPNFDNPPIRDTLDTNDAFFQDSNPGPIRIRFPTDNPGPWFLHCHIDWHLEEGLALVFAEDAALQPQVIAPPKEWCNVCRAYDKFSGTSNTTPLCNKISPPT